VTKCIARSLRKIMQAGQLKQKEGMHQSEVANDDAKDGDIIDVDFEEVSNG
jgi:hypothetical protein